MAHDGGVEEGTRVGGRYVLQSRIADGGMGQVWCARDELLERRVAIKTVKPALAGDPEFAERFRREARLAATLNHPAIAQIHDYGEGPDGAYLVMEFVDGQPLSALIRERRVGGEHFLGLIAQAADALQSAHERGVVHRDVKPANILVTRTGAVKLTDFGIARAMTAARVTRTGEVLGTAHYMSPESALGRETGPSSDVYSLGVVAYEGITGILPFDADSAVAIAMKHVSEPPPSLAPSIPPPVRDVVLRSLAKDPGHRQPNAAQFAREVRSVAAYRPVMEPAAALHHPATPPPGSASGPQLRHSYPPHAGLPVSKPKPITASEPSRASRVIGMGWLGTALLSGLFLLLPMASLNGRSYDGFSLGAVEQSYDPAAGTGSNIISALQLALCLILAVLALPAVLGRGNRLWPIPAVLVTLWAGFFWAAMAGVATGNSGTIPSEASLGVGWVLHGLVGLACFGFVIAALAKPR